MIGAVKGIVAYLGSDNAIIDTPGGVGYRVHMPSSHLAQLFLGKEVRLNVHTAVREDAITLYGFLSLEYYELFELLLTVSGVGPKLALGIVSACKPDEFYLAVQTKDLKVLTKLPGIGKKTAERMLLELKDKIGDGFTEVVGNDYGATVNTKNNAVGEAMEALTALGYSNSEIVPTLKKIENLESLASEEIIRQALKLFAKR
ncbi:MAG: Holliday junction branch migration protein RuvA [Phascolarctobacterium sp.]|nr:Holliday junction branch migration protein RuvA [Phascolarctobacterium sp.]